MEPLKALLKFAECKHIKENVIDPECIHCNFTWCIERIKFLESRSAKTDIVVKWPEKVKRNYDNLAIDNYEDGWNEAVDACIAAYGGAQPVTPIRPPALKQIKAPKGERVEKRGKHVRTKEQIEKHRLAAIEMHKRHKREMRNNDHP